jgi:adenylate cyclase
VSCSGKNRTKGGGQKKRHKVFLRRFIYLCQITRKKSNEQKTRAGMVAKSRHKVVFCLVVEPAPLADIQNAARLESLAAAGGICIAGIVYNQVETKLNFLNLAYEYLGEQTVKNIAKPVPVYRLQLEPEQSSPTVRGRDEVSSPFLALPDKLSIAVLPFANMSGDLEQEYFSDGLTEDLITDLSKLSGLFVSSRNSVCLYKGKAVKPEQVSKELGVRYMVEGSVRKAGSRVRIAAQLIDATTGYHLWAERYDRELQDIFALQDEVTQKIVAALEVKLTEGEQGCFGRTPTDNLAA